MRIQPAIGIAKNVYSDRLNNCKNSEYGHNTEFRGLGTSALVALVAKSGMSAIKGNKIRNYLLDLEEHVNSYNSQKYMESLKALVKTPNSCKPLAADVIDFFLFFLPDTSMVSDVSYIRYKALEKLGTIGDNTQSEIQLKKDFIRSLLQNGHNISPLFVKQFENLSDNIYKNFKEEVINEVLHSSTYNEKRHKYIENCGIGWTEWLSGGYGEYFSPCAYPTVDELKGNSLIIAYEDLKLIESLDTYRYQDFLQTKNKQIQALANIIKNQMAIDYRSQWQPKSGIISSKYKYSDEYMMKKLKEFYREFLAKYPD